MVNSHYSLIGRHGGCRRADCVFNQILNAAEKTRAEREAKPKEETMETS